MSRFIGLPLKHIELDAGGKPVAFTYHGVTYRGKVIHHWILSDRWWERETQSYRRYFRLMTADFQVFDIYAEDTSRGLWVLSHIHD
jgi:Domain of unknown function (DUF6504)